MLHPDGDALGAGQGRARHTHRPQGQQQVGVGEEDQAQGHQKTGDKQGQDVAAVVAATRVPVGPAGRSQAWNEGWGWAWIRAQGWTPKQPCQPSTSQISIPKGLEISH